MIKAFVFGKFLPFHKGHQAMVEFALTKCDFLTILVCCSDKEIIEGKTRKKWIQETFTKINKLEIKIFNYTEDSLTNSSEASLEISKKWSIIFKELFPDYNLVITSEKYGEMVANYMNIKHIEFDMIRQKNPISATSIRNNLFENWNFLPNSVKSFFVIKVVLLGTESTGKTVLTQRLANHFQTSFVHEAGREYISHSEHFAYQDLEIVAKKHAQNIEKIVLKSRTPLILIDTDIYITKSYSIFAFNKELIVNDEIYEINKADLYFYLCNDAEYIQDGQRLTEENRNKLDFFHRKILKEHTVEYMEISGNWNQRFEKMVKEIEKLITQKGQDLEMRKL
ncbi:cytidyltransferase-related enzyme [Bernardetia litoralis DSM 6794]|uniref:Cytidyltransferase-related enzyme n=1 Tax=Bernardetia litoralis (strain ATCC 23117 / DSM 6794 / NBRC 15988 / NCIMB 1366 / Fx l1 / Sio-4) TaxID=880071 RepID=I4AQF5_BERLS|nr:AAA family ATPase [Bernardetia litoralis]AFM06190.1 cytidyltransferase-related enzyme [Bernardetia litoralis DSM 6794]